MKLVAIITLLVLLIAPCFGMTATQSAYLKGFEDGWNLRDLRDLNATAFNIEVQNFNDEVNSSLNASEAANYCLGGWQPPAYELPAIFNLSIPAEELQKA